MEVNILYRPSYSLGVIRLGPNEEIRVEGGAMVSMSQGVVVETKAAGGILKSLARSVLAGESFFQNTFRAPASGGEVTVAPILPGDLFVLELRNESLMVNLAPMWLQRRASIWIPNGVGQRPFSPPRG